MRTTIILTMLALLILSGCSDSTNKGGKAFIGGTEGLRTSFLGGNPPNEIFDNRQSTFAIVVKLENIGEDDIDANEGFVKINGLDPGTYGMTTPKKFFETPIPGAKKNFDGSVLNGGIATVEFGGLAYVPSIQGNLVQQVWADICYKYTTKTTTQLCIKKDPQLLLGDKKICDVEGEKYPQNSGAPIQITSLKESFAGNGKIGITMIITHLGNGDAFFDPRGDLNEPSACNDVESNTQRGKIKITVKPVRIGNSQVTPVCTGLSDMTGTNEGYLRLYKDGSGKEQFSLYCTIDASSTDSIFEVPIDVEATYLYLQHINKELTIRKSIG
ncbi:MAG: hypothetical protein KatS3mg002_0581 [Candidatus Woesearchaeota archaeon]|nr:MAG: hypothetical protein KatS3mg002_0581 [Candidatus Woesearchaeota archaeon]